MRLGMTAYKILNIKLCLLILLLCDILYSVGQSYFNNNSLKADLIFNDNIQGTTSIYQ